MMAGFYSGRKPVPSFGFGLTCFLEIHCFLSENKLFILSILY